MRPTPLGRVASLYYLQHTTAALIAERFRGLQLTHTEVRKEPVGGVWWHRGGGTVRLCGYFAQGRDGGAGLQCPLPLPEGM